MYPVMLALENEKALVIGAGMVGVRKIKSLVNSGADVTVITREVPDEIRKLAEEGALKLEERLYRSSDCEGYFLVIAATDNMEVNRAIFEECRKLGILVNLVDMPELCTFYVPAVVRRGDLQIAITTAGKSPALARSIRKDLEKQYGEEYRGFIDRIGDLREKIKDENPDDPELRNKLIYEMFEREYNSFKHELNSDDNSES